MAPTAPACRQGLRGVALLGNDAGLIAGMHALHYCFVLRKESCVADEKCRNNRPSYVVQRPESAALLFYSASRCLLLRLQAIFRALEDVRHRDWYSACSTTVLRAWQEWEPWEVDLAVLLSPAELERKVEAIWKHQSQARAGCGAWGDAQAESDLPGTRGVGHAHAGVSRIKHTRHCMSR